MGRRKKSGNNARSECALSTAEANDEDENGDTESGPTVVHVRDPRANARGAELECDPRAYRMLHRLGTDWPCPSFDFVPDGAGSERTHFPHALLAACGSQAAEESGHRLTLLRLEGLGPLASDSDESNSDDDSPAATAEHCAFAHPGACNRVAACDAVVGLLATWSAQGEVLAWDARHECAQLCAQGPWPEGRQEQGPTAALQRGTEGYALRWAPLAPAPTLALGSGDGALALARCGVSGQGLVVEVEWAAAPAAIEDLAFSPLEPTVLMTCGGPKAAIRVLDARSGGGPMLVRPGAHGAADANALAWNATVSYLVATGGDDGATKVWDLRRFGPGCAPVATFDYHAGSPISALEWDPIDESALAVCAAGAVDAVSVWDLSVEDDAPRDVDGRACDLPPQLLFVHQGQNDPREVRYHPQIPKLLMTTAEDGFNVFIPNI